MRTRRRFPGRLLREERGQTFALTAVMIAGVMSVIALALDLGVLRWAHAEAKRAADSGALAGASAFLDFIPAATAVGPAQDRAYEFALKNSIMRTAIDSSEVRVLVNLDSMTVAVYVERKGIGLFFARLFNRWQADVNEYSVAIAAPGSNARCVAPLAIADWWAEGDSTTQDTISNRVWDEVEGWSYDPAGDGDAYEGYDAQGDSLTQTGLGSVYRNGQADADGNAYTRDWGRPMVLKPQGPHDPKTPKPGWFFPIRLPGNTGANDYRNAFTQCLPNQEVAIGDTLRIEDGNMVGPTRGAYNDIIGQPGAGPMPDGYWEDPDLFGGQDLVKSNPRTLAFVMITPMSLEDINSQGGNATFEVADIALYYIEGFRDLQGNSNDALMGRFLEYASGGSGGATTGSLILNLRLIK